MSHHQWTMKDIADRLSVHPSTISRALRNDPHISPAIRDEVQRLAGEMNYRPNPLIAALVRSRKQRSGARYRATLGYIIRAPAARAAAFRSDYVKLFEGARRRAEALNYGLEEFDLSDKNFSTERFTKILVARNIHGLLLPPLFSLNDTLPVDWRQFGVVAFGLSHRIKASRVLHNHFTAVQLAIAECVRRGGRRIGLVLPRRVNDKVEKRWLASYLLYQHDHDRAGAKVPPLLLTETDAEATVIAWLKRHQPDTIIGLMNLTPIYRWVKSAGFKVPQDLQLATLDCDDEDTTFAGIYQDYARMGATAVDQLVRMLEQNERGLPEHPVSIMVEGVWTDGKSVGPVIEK